MSWVQGYLPRSRPCLTHLRRRLTEYLSADWFTTHHLGAWNVGYYARPATARAKEVWQAAYDQALLAAKSKKDRTDVDDDFERQKGYLERFVEEKLKPLCSDGFWQEALVFILTNTHGQPLSIKIRQYGEEKPGKHEKFIYTLQPLPGRGGVFDFSPYFSGVWQGRVSTLVLEGEFNWLQLQAQAARWGEGYYLPGLAVGGKNSADLITLCQTLDPGERPVVFYDNDAVDPDTGKPGGYALVEAIRQKTPCYAATTPAKDMDEWIVKTNPTSVQFLALVDAGTYIIRPYEAVRADLATLLAKPSRAMVQRAVDLAWEDLQSRGSVYNAGCGLILIQGERQNELVEVREGHPSWLRLVRRYGIEPYERFCGDLGKAIGVRATEDDIPNKELHILSHYDKDKKCLYVDELDRGLRLNPDGSVTVLGNGDDDVIFTPAGDERHADLELPVGRLALREDGPLDQHILSAVRWDPEKGVPVRTAKQLYKTHVLSMFFPELMHTKVVPVFEGEAGAGKNAICERTGMLFEGERFNVNHMPNEEEKLNDLTVNCIYAAFDDDDSTDRAMETALRGWCTRQYAERRELYTTFGRAKRPTARGLAISTNQNPTRVLATGQRQLMFALLPRQSSLAERQYRSMGMSLIPEFLRHRNAIWSELVADLRGVVMALAKGDMNVKTSFRMADFAALLLLPAEHEGWEAEAHAMLDDMSRTQVKNLAGRNLFTTVMKDYLSAYHGDIGKMKTLAEWQDALQTFVALDRQARERLTGDYLRYMLVGQGKPLVVQELVMEVGTRENGLWDKHNKQCRYAFRLRGDIGAEIERDEQERLRRPKVMPDVEQL